MYPILDGDKAEKTVDVVVDVSSGCKSSKKKNNKSKNIVGDDSRASGSWAGACKIKSRRVWLLILKVVGVACWLPPLRVMCPPSEELKEHVGASSVPGRIELEAQVRSLQDTNSRVTTEKDRSFQTLKANDAKKRVMSLGAHNLSVKIREKFHEVPEVELKLDGNVTVKVVEEVVVLSTKSWPYLLEIVTNKDEDIESPLAIRLLLTLLHLLPRRSHD
nr:hypothetical protein [Tanacetum cinerariifolium]